MRTVRGVRYVMPFREGGSVPALVEADDLGLYVVKLRGAGQGVRALVAELLAGELARAAGLDVPEIVRIVLDRAIAASEPDPEIAAPLEASAGENLGLDYLPGSVTFDPVAGPAPAADLASRITLFDALVLNVDRTPRNPNILYWHKRMWLIDHGASLYFHHGWSPGSAFTGSDDPFAEVRSHVLLPWAAALEPAAQHLERAFDDATIARVVALVPASWLEEDPSFGDDDAHRAAYVAWLRQRRAAIPMLVEEASRARALLV